jgi:hypothetical protein
MFPVFRRQKRGVDGHMRGDTGTRCSVMVGTPRIDEWFSLGRHEKEPHEPSLVIRTPSLG